MSTKLETLKALFPEDVLNISKQLTEGEVKFLKQLNDLLEKISSNNQRTLGECDSARRLLR